MANGDIVFARFPITLDSGAIADTAITTALTTLFPVVTYNVVHTELVFDSGTKTKATVIIIAQDIS